MCCKTLYLYEGQSNENRTSTTKLKLNPWRYSPKEPRLTEAVAAKMAAQGALWLAKHLSLNLNFSFLNQISPLLTQVATQLSS